jgi:hypothetical protein
LARIRRTAIPHDVPWAVVTRTSVQHEGAHYRLERDSDRLIVLNDAAERLDVGAYAEAQQNALVVKLTPGCQTYYDARAYHGNPFTDCDLVAAAVVAAIGGHPDAEAERAGTRLSAMWSHHLAIVGGDDPRRVATTYAPTETKTISGRIQNLAVGGVRVFGCE